MNRRWLVVLAVLVVFGLVWFSLMGFINSRSTDLTVTVSGTVDEVALYDAADPAEPVARIVTNGEDTQQVVTLPNAVDYSFWRQMPPAKYYFVTRQETETYQGGTVCCAVGLGNHAASLDIAGLSQWERMDQ